MGRSFARGGEERGLGRGSNGLPTCSPVLLFSSVSCSFVGGRGKPCAAGTFVKGGEIWLF